MSKTIRSWFLLAFVALSAVAGCGDSTPATGNCTLQATQVARADGGTVTCYCASACGCFTSVDGGTRCP
jgi:hypothetical protein